jgi:ferrochelatase
VQYHGSPQFTHQQADKIGILITNLGTPEAPTKQALRPYLKQFLSDPRVVEVPRLLWWFILNGVILNIRPKRSAEAYAAVWTEQGSPLMEHTQAISDALQQRFGDEVIVRMAMRYGEPSVASGLEALQQQGARKILVLPLYPQYSASTVGSTFDAIAEDFRQRRWLPELRFINQYTDFEPYIAACADKIQQHWQQHGRADKLILSYHGLPERYLKNGDPYFCQCHKTSRLIAERLQLSDEQVMTTFQSRFGREPWLKPYTDETLKSLPASGVKSIQIFCPGFAADCLETIEEIGVENRDYFLEAGGERYQYIAALNSDSKHIDALEQLLRANLQGWQTPAHDTKRAARATKLGAEK